MCEPGFCSSRGWEGERSVGGKDVLPFRPVWMQSYTSASSPLSTPRRINPVRSAYSSSFNCATCAACAASALPTMTVLVAGGFPFMLLPGVLAFEADSMDAEAWREAASLALRTLDSFWASVREVLSWVIRAWAVERADSVEARVVRREGVVEARIFWVASSFLREAMRSLAAGVLLLALMLHGEK